jgi:hypothetical protein
MSIFKNLIFVALFLLTGCEASLTPKQMPLIEALELFTNATPEEHREEAVQKWLGPTLRISNGGVGSGTICYYDKEKKLAWIISCGHLFSSPEEKHVTLEVFYKNGKKLDSPEKFSGDVVAAKINGYEDDLSLITFTPNWEPDYFPIAQEYTYVSGTTLYSCGCDGATEPACYFVKVDTEKQLLVTRENSPRPGRSGGGLFSEDGFCVAVCVRTSDRSGNGLGYFVTLTQIHAFCKLHNVEWLCSVGKKNALLQSIPIIDRNSQQKVYPPDYIPSP